MKSVTGLLFMPKPVGGRGLKAPYESTHIRIPAPLKPIVQQLIAEFHAEQLDQQQNSVTPLPLVEAIEIAKHIIKVDKLSARKSLIKLLTAIYKQPIDHNQFK